MADFTNTASEGKEGCCKRVNGYEVEFIRSDTCKVWAIHQRVERGGKQVCYGHVKLVLDRTARL